MSGSGRLRSVPGSGLPAMERSVNPGEPRTPRAGCTLKGVATDPVLGLERPYALFDVLGCVPVRDDRRYRAYRAPRLFEDG